MQSVGVHLQGTNKTIEKLKEDSDNDKNSKMNDK